MNQGTAALIGLAQGSAHYTLLTMDSPCSSATPPYLKWLKPYWVQGRMQTAGAFLQFCQEAQMELRKKSDDTKIIAAIICLLIGFLFIWNITAHISDIYELRLDAETCNQVRTLGLEPSDNCVITAPFRPAELGPPAGYLMLPDGSDIQITPVAANQTNRSAEWSVSMKAQFWMALLFWVATLVLLLSAFRDKK
ncbi:MAG TPA: hypothetical protein VFQ98_04070 [Gallionella sp.]|nr:hypothetical protein [Gallionella sp.]